MSTHSRNNSQQQQQQQILQTCQRINQALEIDQQQFSLESLTHLDWYMTVLEIIYPQLQKQFSKIRMIPDSGKAFDKLLVMLAKEEIIQQDFLQIKGQDIIEGDIESVYYVVQLLSALIQREGEEEQQQEGEEKGEQQQNEDEEDGPKQQQGHSQTMMHKDTQSEQQYQQSFEPQEASLQQSSLKKVYPSEANPSSSNTQPQHNNIQPHQQPQQQQQQQFKNPFTQYDSHSQPSPQQECHSVLGIHNQFRDEQQQDDNQTQQHNHNQEQSIKRPIGGGMSDSYPYNNKSNSKPVMSNVANINSKQQQNVNYQQQAMVRQQQQSGKQPLSPIYPQQGTNNYQPNNNINYNQQQQSKQPSKQQSKQPSSNDLISTKANYQQFGQKQQQLKSTTTNNNIHYHNKQFSSSSQEQNGINHHHYTQLDQYHHQELQNKYNPLQPNHNNDESQSQDENDYFINPTIKKYKSQQKKIKHIQSPTKKSTNKKKLQYQSPTTAKILQINKSPKKLVTHPTIKKQYRKAANQQAKKLTTQVKNHLASTLKKKKLKPKVHHQIVGQNAAIQQMGRKKKQLKVKLTDYKQQKQLRNQQQLQSHTQQAKTNIQLGKILNWRQGQLKKQKQEFQKAMQMKVQLQKQNYIKKINNLLIKLQKEKQFHEQQTYKQKLFKENQQAAKRLTAIQQWYKDRIHMLKEKNANNRNQRTLLHTGHKQILKQIQKDLKRDNQKQIMAMTMKYRKQQAQIQNDLEQLQREIIKVYKRN